MSSNLICDVVCLNKPKIESIRAKLSSNQNFQKSAAMLKALGHPVRLAILEVLHEEVCCVCDLANILMEPVSTVSQHLKVLKTLGLIHARREAKLVFYSIPNELSSLHNSLFQTVDSAKGNLYVEASFS